MDRHQLTDEQWDRIADLFPLPKATGRPPRCRRQVIDGILWILNTGAPWRDLPDAYGPWATAWDLFNAWNQNGTLTKILERLQGQVVIDPELWCVDGTVVRAHKAASGGGKKTTPTNRKTTRLAAAGVV